MTIFETEEELERFWEWVALASRDWEAFAAALRDLDRETLTRFSWTFQEFAGEVAEALEEAGFEHFEDSVSDDALEDICGWAVARGRDFYAECLEDTTLIPESPEGVGIDIQYEAADAFRERFGEDLPSY